MANGATSPSRLGQVNLTGDTDALFLKVFSGEILTTFEELNVMKDLHMVRTIQSGKSAQFPLTGIATAKYHTPGDNIADAGAGYLSGIKHAEKIITNSRTTMMSVAFTLRNSVRLLPSVSTSQP